MIKPRAVHHQTKTWARNTRAEAEATEGRRQEESARMLATAAGEEGEPRGNVKLYHQRTLIWRESRVKLRNKEVAVRSGTEKRRHKRLGVLWKFGFCSNFCFGTLAVSLLGVLVRRCRLQPKRCTTNPVTYRNYLACCRCC